MFTNNNTVHYHQSTYKRGIINVSEFLSGHIEPLTTHLVCIHVLFI